MAFCEKCRKKIKDKYSLCDACLAEDVDKMFASDKSESLKDKNAKEIEVKDDVDKSWYSQTAHKPPKKSPKTANSSKSDKKEQKSAEIGWQL